LPRRKLSTLIEAARDAAQEDIQRGEERWLGKLSADDRRLFLRVLRQLSATDGG
jgi:hypothetical protein